MLKEMVTPIVFRRRLGIDNSTLKVALRHKVIDTTEVEGKDLIEWHSQSKKFIEESPRPNRYTPGNIASRVFEKAKKKVTARSGLVPVKRALSYLLPEARAYISDKMVDELVSTDGNHVHVTGLKPNRDENGIAARIDDIDEDLENDEKEFTPNMGKRGAEAVKQVYLAKQAKLKFLRDSELLIEIKQVEDEWKSIAVHLRKQLLAFPDRVCELYASMTESSEIRQDMRRELTYILTSLKYDPRENASKKKV